MCYNWVRCIRSQSLNGRLSHPQLAVSRGEATAASAVSPDCDRLMLHASAGGLTGKARPTYSTTFEESWPQHSGASPKHLITFPPLTRRIRRPLASLASRRHSCLHGQHTRGTDWVWLLALVIAGRLPVVELLRIREKLESFIAV